MTVAANLAPDPTEWAVMLLRVISRAFDEAAENILTSAHAPGEHHLPDEARFRPKGPLTHAIRMGLHLRALTVLVALGGTVPHAEFVKICRDAGYGRGYCKLYKEHNPMVFLDKKIGMVSITDHGKDRLETARKFFGITS